MAKEHHGREYVIGAIGAIAEYLALRYGMDWLAWLAAFLLWLAVVEFTRRWASLNGWIYAAWAGLILAMAVSTYYLIRQKPVPEIAKQSSVLTVHPAKSTAATDSTNAAVSNSEGNPSEHEGDKNSKRPKTKRHSSNQGVDLGKDATAVGRIPVGSKLGDGSTYVGATDSKGNTILNLGGTAIGNGAQADPTSMAIGAHANAGQQVGGIVAPQTTINAPNGIGISGGQVTNPTVNNFAPPERHLTPSQVAAVGTLAASLPNDAINWLTVESINVPEAITFGDEIQRIFKEHGKTRAGVVIWVTAQPPFPEGVVVLVKDDHDEHFAIAQNITNSLASMGISKLSFAGGGWINVGQIKIIVGTP
jgi:hypothetical protein